MVLLVAAVLIGIAAGRARAPLGARGHRPRFTDIWLLGVGAAGNMVSYFLSEGPATVVLALSLVVLLAFVARNSSVTGVVVIGVGLLCNLLALVLNNGMPVRPSALTAAGVVSAAEVSTLEFSGPRHLETSSDRFAVLGDVLPVGLPIGREVMSFGDLIVVFGAADAVRELARRRRRLWSAAERDDYRASHHRLDDLSREPQSEGDRVIELPDTGETHQPETRPPLARRRPLVAAATSD